MGKNNIIEVNGRQYDAATGSLLGESRVQATPASRARMAHQGRSIDGFRRADHTATKAASVPSKKVVVPSGVHRVKAPSITAHKPQRPTTLMRHIVKKPVVELKPRIKTSMPSSQVAKPLAEVSLPLEKKLSAAHIDPFRLAHANHVSKSQHIQRFRDTEQSTNSQFVPAVALPERPATSTAGSSFVPASDPKASTSQLFEHALAQAKSHEQLPHQPSGRRAARHRRLVSFTAGLAAFLVIGGFIAYLNVPAIEINIASFRAGFHASLPTYAPNGYALAHGAQASGNTIALTYHSGNSDYTITQAASNWDSSTLLAQETADEQGSPVHTVQSEGRLIYIYPDSTTWVNGGILYTITGNAALSTNQLVALATSM